MKKFWIFLGSLALPLGVGSLAAFLTRGNMMLYAALERPPLSPPAWLFPVVWSILYVLMGLASWLVTVSGESPETIAKAQRPYYLQLAVNFFWSLIFFNLQNFLFAFIWLVLLWVLILITLRRFYAISKTAGWLLVPYLVWVAFAGYLNFAIFLLNG